MTTTSNGSPPVDKEYLYAEFQRGQRWRDDLQRKAAHKALDITDDDGMNVDNSRHSYGLGWKELAIGVLGLGLVGGWLADRLQPPAAPSTPAVCPQPAEVEPIRGKIRFWVEDPEVNINVEN